MATVIERLRFQQSISYLQWKCFHFIHPTTYCRGTQKYVKHRKQCLRDWSWREARASSFRFGYAFAHLDVCLIPTSPLIRKHRKFTAARCGLHVNGQGKSKKRLKLSRRFTMICARCGVGSEAGLAGGGAVGRWRQSGGCDVIPGRSPARSRPKHPPATFRAARDLSTRSAARRNFCHPRRRRRIVQLFLDNSACLVCPPLRCESDRETEDRSVPTVSVVWNASTDVKL